jgi:hypothetical protein
MTKTKSFKFNDNVRTTKGTPIVGAIFSADNLSQLAIVTSFKSGKSFTLPYSILVKRTNKQADTDFSRLLHKLA